MKVRDHGRENIDLTHSRKIHEIKNEAYDCRIVWMDGGCRCNEADVSR